MKKPRATCADCHTEIDPRAERCVRCNNKLRWRKGVYRNFRGGRRKKTLAVLLLLASSALAADDVRIDGTTTIEDSRGQIVVPRIVNDSGRRVRARVRVKGTTAGWSSIEIPPGAEATQVLDSSFMKGRGKYELELETDD